MKNHTIYPILGLMVSGALAFSTHAQTLNLTATHEVSSVTNFSDGTATVTLALTLHNQSGENLSNVRLLPMPGLGFGYPATGQSLDIDTIESGATLERTWSLSTLGGLSSDSPYFVRIMFAAEATDANQNFKTFPVDSVRGDTQ